MKSAGIDLGEKRIGVAICDDPELPVLAWGTIEVTPGSDAADLVARFVVEQNVDEIIVGLPIRTDGREGRAARNARRVARAIADRTGRTVHLEDERMTTVQAQRVRTLAQKKGRKGIDADAAAILLQTFVDRRKHSWRQNV